MDKKYNYTTIILQTTQYEYFFAMYITKACIIQRPTQVNINRQTIVTNCRVQHSHTVEIEV